MRPRARGWLRCRAGVLRPSPRGVARDLRRPLGRAAQRQVHDARWYAHHHLQVAARDAGARGPSPWPDLPHAWLARCAHAADLRADLRGSHRALGTLRADGARPIVLESAHRNAPPGMRPELQILQITLQALSAFAIAGG